MDAKRITSLALAALLGVGVAGGIAHAKDARDRDRREDQRDVAALAAGVKVTLQQAIATAEQQVAGGRAVGADLSRERGGAVRIAVEVAVPQGVKTVRVDAQTGQVAATHDGGQDDGDKD